jgi:hypothetical protein
MTQINKDTFFYYFLRETGGLYDPRQLNLMIEKLKEWLPENSPDMGDNMKEKYDLYSLGQKEYKDFIMNKLK